MKGISEPPEPCVELSAPHTAHLPIRIDVISVEKQFDRLQPTCEALIRTVEPALQVFSGSNGLARVIEDRPQKQLAPPSPFPTLTQNFRGGQKPFKPRERVYNLRSILKRRITF